MYYPWKNGLLTLAEWRMSSRLLVHAHAKFQLQFCLLAWKSQVLERVKPAAVCESGV